jgi:hypothetical protein
VAEGRWIAAERKKIKNVERKKDIKERRNEGP